MEMTCQGEEMISLAWSWWFNSILEGVHCGFRKRRGQSLEWLLA
jgi:hypothetical protein